MAYTLTDTTGVNHTFSDTARLPPDGRYDTIINGKVTVVEPFAYIWQPFPDDSNRYQFYFIVEGSYDNDVILFSLPYYQATVSGTPGDPESRFSLPYVADVASFNISTNISDSTNGYITGSFNISATTIDSAKIKVTGQFTKLPTNFHP